MLLPVVIVELTFTCRWTGTNPNKFISREICCLAISREMPLMATIFQDERRELTAVDNLPRYLPNPFQNPGNGSDTSSSLLFCIFP